MRFVVPRISVVVPVYNTEKTLPSCLDSLLGQTFADIEIICVDDGSPDNASAVLERYASDARVKVISQKNAGLSAARNTGMAAACGDIVCFVDSDDTVEPVFAERIVQTFEKTDADVVAFGARCEPVSAASKRVKRLLGPADAVYEGFDSSLLFSANAQPYACRTALRRTFIERENIRFDPVIRFAEDVPFHFTVYPLSRRTVLISDRLYVYHMREGSLTHDFNDAASCSRKLDSHLAVFESIFRAWRERGLLGCCPGETIEWCLDFTLFDIVRLSVEEQGIWLERLAELLNGAFGKHWEMLPQKAVVRRVAHEIARKGTSFTVVSLIPFFIATRGFKQCIERFI